METTSNKKRRKKIVTIILSVLLVLVLIFGLLAASFLGVFAKGNSGRYNVSRVQTIENSPLKGKTILYLGSSVTAGMGSLGTSFVDYIAKMDDSVSIKEAVSGTTLTDIDEKSYVQRMLALDKELKIDAFVCQLSTNDAKPELALSLGAVSDSMNLADFDTHTIIGAMEYIIAYARDTWNCPVVFYTGTHYDDANYAAMVDALLQLQDKWDIGVIDLWNDRALNDITDAQRKLYMKDDIHPMKAGYLEWWTPVMRAYLIDYLA